jgi:hypothetical protein
MIAETTQSLSYILLTTSDSCSNLLIPYIFTVLVGLIFWFMRDKFTGLSKNDDRVESKIDKNFSWLIKETRTIDSRVSRIEGSLGLALLISKSPLHLSPIGEEILAQSGIKEAADKFKIELLTKIKEANPQNAYDVQEVTRRIFQEFNFGEEYTTKIKNYSFQTGKWNLSDITEVGAIYFRDIALLETGFDYKDLDKTKPPDRG